MKPLHPSLQDEGVVPEQSTFLVINVLRVERPLPFDIYPLEMFVGAELITFSDTPFELADIFFEEPLNSSRPRAFDLFASQL